MLEEKVEAFLRKRSIHLYNKGIVVGVSGGPDSLSLLHFLWKRREKWGIQLVCAHLDHMFRGKESELEGEFVKAFCEERSIPFEFKQVNVPKRMEQTGLSSQVAGREERYAFYKEVMEKYQYSTLMLGHHGDDQIETILMRLTRGSTGKSRAGIPVLRSFHNGVIIRPFLCVSKDEIEEYCKRHNLEPRRDPSNKKDIYSRNRFRKYVLPFLKQENPHVHEHFQRFAEELLSDEEFLFQLAEEKLHTILKERKNDKIELDLISFRKLPLPLQRRSIQLILNYLYEVKPSSLTAIHMEQIFSIIYDPHPSKRLDFPNGLRVVRSYESCYFLFHTKVENKPYYVELKEGRNELPNGEILLLEFKDEESDAEGIFPRTVVSSEALPLFVRTRKPGDKMSIKGMDGSKKLKSLFIDEKISVYKRDDWPIVVDKDDNIVWVPGLRRSTLYINKSTLNRPIVLTYISNDRLGGTLNL